MAAAQGEDSVLLNRKGMLADLAKKSKVFRLSPSGPSSSPEAAWLGLNPEDWSFGQGALTFSWLKLSPPERSLCFHLSLASLTDDRVREAAALKLKEEKEVIALLQRLDSRRIILAPGRGLDHGLVLLNASPDLISSPLKSVLGQNWIEAMPEGDDSDLLRQWIEDAHELFSKLELNKRRRDEGLAEVNLAWPWGQGRPAEGISLPLRRGFVVKHITRSIRMEGMVRLFGERVLWGARLPSEIAQSSEPIVQVMPQAASSRESLDLDQLDQALNDLEASLLRPLLEANLSGFSLTILAPQDSFDAFPPRSGLGLGLNFNTERRDGTGALPFDERVIWEGEGKLLALHEAVNLALMGGSRGS